MRDRLARAAGGHVQLSEAGFRCRVLSEQFVESRLVADDVIGGGQFVPGIGEGCCRGV
jgi:hypothetical protein